MTKQEKLRIKLLKIVEKDKNKLEVSEIATIFCGLLSNYFDKTKTGQAVKNKITESEYITFVHGFCNSFLSSIYINAADTPAQQQKRLDFVNKVNQDVLAYKEEI